MISRRTLLATSFLPLAAQAQPAAGTKVHIGQATAALAFLPLMAARALGTFPPQNLDLFWAAIPGGDLACLAALDRGDLDFAAIGVTTLLDAIARGQPVQMVFALMSRLSLELVVSNQRLADAGISPADDPLERRLQLLKGATIGVSAQNGAQAHAARWLAHQAGLDPRHDIELAVAGPPSALQAALASGHIDAYLLSPPEGLLSEDARTGQVLIRMATDFPQLANIPFLALAAKLPIAPDTRALLVATAKALQSANAQLLADPAGSAAKIHAGLFPRLNVSLITAGLDRLKPGLAPTGRFDPAALAALADYAGATSGAATGPAQPAFWTNEYSDEAAQ